MSWITDILADINREVERKPGIPADVISYHADPMIFNRKAEIAEQAIKTYLAEAIGGDYSFNDDAMPTKYEREKLKALNRLLAIQRERLGLDK